MDDIAEAQRAEGKTPQRMAQSALRAVKSRAPRQLKHLTVPDLGDAAYEQVADLITDLLHLVDASGADWEAVLDSATGHFLAERGD